MPAERKRLVGADLHRRPQPSPAVLLTAPGGYSADDVRTQLLRLREILHDHTPEMQVILDILDRVERDEAVIREVAHGVRHWTGPAVSGRGSKAAAPAASSAAHSRPLVPLEYGASVALHLFKMLV